MGIVERKERQRAELRETILAAARTIFLSEGAEALTMRKIADAIEYSPGTIYLYFASREEIALHLVREGFEKLLAAFRPAAAVPDPLERLRAIGRAYVHFGFSDPQTYKLIFMLDATYVYTALGTPAGQSNEPGQRAFDVLAATVREAIACGELRELDADRCAEALWASLHGVISLHITCPDMLGDAHAVAALVADATIAGLRP